MFWDNNSSRVAPAKCQHRAIRLASNTLILAKQGKFTCQPDRTVPDHNTFSQQGGQHSLYPGKPEKAQISVDGADDLYREIRVENTLQDASGKEVELKAGAEVDVTIEAEPNATIPKKPAEAVIASDGNLRRQEKETQRR